MEEVLSSLPISVSNGPAFDVPQSTRLSIIALLPAAVDAAPHKELTTRSISVSFVLWLPAAAEKSHFLLLFSLSHNPSAMTFLELQNEINALSIFY